MKLKKFLSTCAVIIFFMILFIIPIILIVKLSKAEKKVYIQDDTYNFKFSAYGEPCEVTRKDVEEYYVVNGIMTSDKFDFCELGANNNSKIRFVVNQNDEVKKGDIVAYVDKNSIVSTIDGIVKETSGENGGYVKIQSFDELELLCNVQRKIAEKLATISKLHLEDGTSVEVSNVSKTVNEGKVDIRLKLSNNKYQFSEEVEKLKIFTGYIYKNVLTVNSDCVYTKDNSDVHYVRLLDNTDSFAGEAEVKIGFETDEITCITGVEEGAICDSGYKKLMNQD